MFQVYVVAVPGTLHCQAQAWPEVPRDRPSVPHVLQQGSDAAVAVSTVVGAGHTLAVLQALLPVPGVQPCAAQLKVLLLKNLCWGVFVWWWRWWWWGWWWCCECQKRWQQILRRAPS
jgi:hypothetical protein